MLILFISCEESLSPIKKICYWKFYSFSSKNDKLYNLLAEFLSIRRTVNIIQIIRINVAFSCFKTSWYIYLFNVK